ncbi:MAG: DNA gyrase C-terminal beta-propeller domain-containing protein, partial [Patescibacteria group bacterium]
GQGIRFKPADIRERGRGAAGVRAIKLSKNDEVVGLGVVNKETAAVSEILVVSANGFGKRTKVSEYKIQHRGGSGIKTAKVTPKTGKLMKAVILEAEASELLAISKQGQVIRTKLDEIPTLGRATQGVRVMKVRAGDNLASLTCL